MSLSGAQLEFLAEGNANIIYEVRPALSDGASLVRLRKSTTTVPCAEAYASFVTHIKPLFEPHELLEQQLIPIAEATIDELNRDLKKRDGLRHPKRRGVFLAKDTHGLLLENMTSSQVIEFKPKWLSQSPTAPPDSRRCRTCARHALARYEALEKGQPSKAFFCPLDLFSSDPKRLDRAASYILPSEAGPDRRARFVEWLQSPNILYRLRSQQNLYGAHEPPSLESCIAMTLRDCSLFLKFPLDPCAPLQAKLADLDVKSPSKAGYWQALDEQLIREGWYQGTESEKKRQPIDCALYQTSI